MSSPSEVRFDCNPQIYSMLQKPFGDCHQKTQELEEFIARLEDERLKIDAFKRELPMCMQLITDAMEASRKQLQLQTTNQHDPRPVLEEFIPLRNTIPQHMENHEDINTNNITSDKANWMTSAQLWNQNENEEETKAHAPYQESENKWRVSGGGAFLPFSPSKDHHHRRVPSSYDFSDLSLSSSHKEEMMTMEDKRNNDTNGGKGGSSVEKEQVSGTGNNAGQGHRKARRCWSPDLHRRFVNALHMLGGSQVATPKQIREVMKVDGLTNDEVKSHLQKYRLHTRRSSPSPQASGAPAQLVVLGGIWVPQEYAAATHHHVTPPFCSPAPPQESSSYQLIHHHPQHQHVQYLYNRPLSNTDIQGGADDPLESIEDGKSDSGRSLKKTVEKEV